MNKKQSTTQTKLSPYNLAVKTAYFQLLKETKRLLATIEQHELRYTLQREDNAEICFGLKVHEIISPVIYLSLECKDGEDLTIHFGIEQFEEENEYSDITGKFLRILYKLTSVEQTLVNVENCICTRYVITNCSELYEVVEGNNHYHIFSLIKHKPATSSKKRHLSVA
jgi:hypothetical protein